MEQKKKNSGKNSVKLTENKKSSYTRVEKNKKAAVDLNKSISNEVASEEKSHTAIIVVALAIAVVLAIFAYTQMNQGTSASDKEEEKKDVVEIQEDIDADIEEEEEIEEQSETSIVAVQTPYNEETKEKVTPVVAVKYYSLSFETNGGEEIQKQIYTSEEVTTSIVPKKEGWTFAGWYQDEELLQEFTFEQTLQADTTIYAKWVKMIYFTSEDGEIMGIIPVALNENIPLLEDKDLEDGVLAELQTAAWVVTQEDENGNLMTYEILPNTVLTEELFDSDSSYVYLTLQPRQRFTLEFLLDENSDAIYTQEVIEMREISMELVNAKLLENDPTVDLTKIAWYYLDLDGNKWNFAAGQVANTEITKLYLEEAYTVVYIEKPVPETPDEVVEDIILKQESVAVDSRIPEGEIYQPEEKEDLEFDGWYDYNQETGELGEKLTADTIINEDKVFVGKWDAKEQEPIEGVEPILQEAKPNSVDEETGVDEKPKDELEENQNGDDVDPTDSQEE